jgi:aerobic-type carbon monoxide dehydrogenase small subunit (CoxS/CutS family)
MNGHVHAVDVDPETPLLYALRDDLQFLSGSKRV